MAINVRWFNCSSLRCAETEEGKEVKSMTLSWWCKTEETLSNNKKNKWFDLRGEIRQGGWNVPVRGTPGRVELGLRGGAGPTRSQVLVDIRGEEPWVGVPVHQRVDLQLGVFKRVRRGVLHFPVYHLPNPGIQTNLEGKQLSISHDRRRNNFSCRETL